MLSQYQIEENSIEQELLNAIENEDITLADTLIHNGARLNRIDDECNTLLMRKKVMSEPMFSFLLSKSEEQNWLTILKIKNKKSQSVFDFYLTPEGLPLLRFLLTHKTYSEYLPSLREFPHFLDEARRASFNAKTHQEFLQFNEICDLIKTLPVYNKISEANQLESETAKSCRFILFGHENNLEKENDRTKKLKNIMTQIYVLFKNPQKCFHYLDFLNSEFERYYQETYHQPFPKFDKNSVKYINIDGITYPIPTVNTRKDFIGLGEKHNILEQYLILFFKKHGLADESIHWISFIPNAIANETVKRGDFIKEDKYGIGLLHGRIIHQIQAYLILCFLQEIDLGDFSPKEIFAAFIDMVDKDNHPLWSVIRDRSIKNRIMFSDPHQFSGFLMRDKKMLDWCNAACYNWSSLTDSLIDSFCKNYLDLLDAFNTMHDINFNIDSATFASYLDDLTTRLFELKSLTAYALQQAKKRPHDPSNLFGDDFAVVHKQYKIENLHFIPRVYPSHLHNTIQNDLGNIQKLLDKGADPNLLTFTDYHVPFTSTYIKHTPLTLAVKCENWECFMALVKHPHINLNARDSEGKTALYHALDGRYYSEISQKMAEYLSNQPGIDPSIGCFEDNITPLNMAIQFFPNKFDLFLEKLPDHCINSQFSARVYSILRRLNLHGEKTFLSIITKNGALPQPRYIEHFTLLQHAILCKEVGMVKKLLQRGASTAVNENGLDVLVFAKLLNNQEIIDILSTHQEKNNKTNYFNFFGHHENNVHEGKKFNIIPVNNYKI